MTTGHSRRVAQYSRMIAECMGYSDGLQGHEIPEIARIIAVADAYDAMTSKRAYRDIMSQDKVREQIVMGKGSQFDEKIASIMLSLIDKDTDYKMQQC